MPIISGLTDAMLVKLFHTDHSDKEIAETYGISVQAVAKRRVKLGLIREKIVKEVSRGLATRWDILTPAKGAPHYSQHAARMLKIWLRMGLGDDTLSAHQKETALKWIKELRERDEVLCYDPESRDGWYYRPRKPQDGQRIIDWPAELPYPSEGFKRALDLPPEPAIERV